MFDIHNVLGVVPIPIFKRSQFQSQPFPLVLKIKRRKQSVSIRTTSYLKMGVKPTLETL